MMPIPYNTFFEPLRFFMTRSNSHRAFHPGLGEGDVLLGRICDHETSENGYYAFRNPVIEVKSGYSFCTGTDI